LSEASATVCPSCGSSKVYNNGHRTLSDGLDAQRYLCRGCGYRFTDPASLNVVRDNKRSSQICALKVKNLANTTKTKIVVGDIEKLPQDTRGLLTKYAAYLEREGYYSETSYFDLIRALTTDSVNLLNSEDVKAKIAQHRYTDRKTGEVKAWKESVKMLAVYAYDAFCKMEGITWSKPHYHQQDTVLIIPDEKDLDGLIASTQSIRMAAFLQTLKETYADPGEILALHWNEIQGNVITIAHPCKGHLTGQYQVSARLIAMLNQLPKTDKRVFPTNYHAMRQCLDSLKKKAARKLQNPRLLDITFKSFRHWGGSMLAHYTDGNVLIVKKMLRHKSVLNTMKYIHTINFADEDFEETVATTPDEIRQLGKAGWVKYDEGNFNGVSMHFYKRPKRFSGLH
jgi:integrase